MDGATWQRILAGLEAAGWAWNGDNLYAPHGSMCLGRAPWDDSFERFNERMRGRRDRIQRNHDAWERDDKTSAAEALSDVTVLVEVLRELEG